ncbi:glycosyltransferase family 39 protein [Candidatus Roizmanbacteria bacterium]|nr:MAG: glycosyltransferase family 39 protein [Candidatus Roizmanbacteria bacterium]
MSVSSITKHKLLLVILLLAVFLRIYGLNWDSGYHFHPDERMLIMVTERITFFSQLNPDFFNYGSLPVYILAAVAQLSQSFTQMPIDTYDGLLPVGRLLSTINDLIVVVLIYSIAYNLFKNRAVAAWGSFFYAVAFFPIQNSHFFIVDTFLNLFITLLLFLLLQYQQHPSFRKAVIIGIVYAAALTTKVTPVIFAPVLLFVLFFPKTVHENIFDRIRFLFQKDRFKSLNSIILKNRSTAVLAFTLTTLLFSFLFMPYGYIEWQRFLKDVLLQVRMNSDPYVFPYTLQYIGTLPYLYYLENIFLWGLGPVISVFSLIGIGVWFAQTIHSSSHIKKISVALTKILHSPFTVIFLFYLLYFVIIGKSAVKFMRYMLVMYPFFAVMAGYGASVVMDLYKPHGGFFSRSMLIPRLAVGVSIICFSLLWTLPFLSIYSTKSTRITATEWINNAVPAGSIIAVEHWDDRVPIYDHGKYQYEELTLYDIPDNEFKWNILNEKLERSDYIVIASNRLYIPLQRLQECDEHGRCYPMTGEYYRRLFANERGFVKVAEFTSYPRLTIGNWQLKIIDDHADESFTVYDHPKIMVFKKI